MHRAYCRKIVRNILSPPPIFLLLFILEELQIHRKIQKKYFFHAPFTQPLPVLMSCITIVKYQNQEWTLVESTELIQILLALLALHVLKSVYV